MLEFPREFFAAQTREDFLVDATMKSFWAAELEVLREIAEICERHGLEWYAAYGTLLGAVRHEGFVPWDDDMDIWMKREDYLKFLEIAEHELPAGYLIQSPLTKRGYLQFHSCVMNAESVSVSPERLRDFHGCPFVVGVDIFPLDYLPDDPEEREQERELFDVISTAATMVKKQERTAEMLERLLQAITCLEEQCVVSFDRALLKPEYQDELVSQLYRLGNQLTAQYGSKKSKNLVMYMDYINWKQKVYPAEWFAETEYLCFEGFGIPAPAAYDAVLRTIYGEYEKRIRNTSMHGYPMYQKQLEQMRKMLAQMEVKAAPFLILYPDRTCYGVLADFADRLAEALTKLGQKVEIRGRETDAPLTVESFTKGRWKGIIGFQTLLLEKEWMDSVQSTVFQFWLDNPAFFNIFGPGSKVRYLCQDAGYAAHLRTYYHAEYAVQLPPGGVDCGMVQNTDREYDLVFIGTYEPPVVDKSWSTQEQQFFDYMLQNRSLTFEQGLVQFLGISEKQSREVEFLRMLWRMTNVCRTVIRKNREEIVEAILQAGFTIDVYGDSWKVFPTAHSDKLRVHPAVSVEESLQILGHAKIGLNIMTWHKAGMTERVANIMLSGAVCLSDETSYLKEHFVDGRELVLFSPAQLEQLPIQISKLLTNEEERRKIALAGYEKAAREHTWQSRAEEILRMAEE